MVTELLKMLVREEIDEKSMVYIDAGHGRSWFIGWEGKGGL